MLLLSPGLRLLAQTPETDAYLRALVPPEQGAAPVPAGAYNVAAQLLAVEGGVDRNPPLARVHLPAGRWLSLRAARIADPQPGLEGTIAVTIEPASPPERLQLLSRASALTHRETELLRHLATGADTRELARRMCLSEHTVQDHLKSIFAKTATRPDATSSPASSAADSVTHTTVDPVQAGLRAWSLAARLSPRHPGCPLRRRPAAARTRKSFCGTLTSGSPRTVCGRCGRCEAQPMRSASETMIPSGPRT